MDPSTARIAQAVGQNQVNTSRPRGSTGAANVNPLITAANGRTAFVNPLRSRESTISGESTSPRHSSVTYPNTAESANSGAFATWSGTSAIAAIVRTPPAAATSPSVRSEATRPARITNRGVRVRRLGPSVPRKNSVCSEKPVRNAAPFQTPNRITPTHR